MKETNLGGRKIDRRGFLIGAGAGAAMLSLGACGVANKANNDGSNEADKAKGPFSWKRAKGATITLALVQHQYTDSLVKQLPEFTKLTGIKVKRDVLPEEQQREKLQTDLSSRTGNYDAFMTGPATDWQWAAPGYIEPLDSYLKNDSLTEKSWDFKDFFSGAIDANRWKKSAIGKPGTGPLWALPVNGESYCLFCRKDILQEMNMKAPETVDELISAVKKVDGKSFGGKKVSGFVARGDGTWPTITSGYSTVYFGYGAPGITPDGKVELTAPKSVEATKKWADLMSVAPRGVGSYTWYEAQNDYAAGNAAFFIDADHMSAIFEDPKSSSVVGKVHYALPPKGPSGRASNIWLWSLGMSAASKNKVASWLFLQWATSKKVLQNSVTAGNINPTRSSVANSQTMTQYTAKWGTYNEVWKKIAKDYAKWRFIASPKFPDMADRWATALQAVVLGKSSAEEALASAQKDIKSTISSMKG